MKPWLLWSCFSVICLLVNAHPERGFTDKRMKIIHTWKSLEFDFPNEATRSGAIRNKHFIPGNPVPIDVDVYERENGKPKIFITVPRFQDGVPVTVGYVTDKTSVSGDPIIAPYPNWEFNKISGCNGIISVYRVKVDAACKRIWILDTGVKGSERLCPPQLLSFSLESDRLLSRYAFPEDLYNEDSLFVTAVVDVPTYRSQHKCQDAHVYIADVTGFSLVVYDHRHGSSWKIRNKYFYPYPRYGTFNINGDSFDLMDGILGLALSPSTNDGDRILFFHSLSSVEEGWIKTSVLKNETLFKHDPEAAPSEIHIFSQGRSSQSAPQDVDRNGVMYFGLMSDLAVGCWNINEFPHYGGNKIDKIVQNPNTMQFASGLKVIPSKTGQDQLWVLTSSFQRFMTGKLKPSEINFRIQAALTDDLIRGSRCAPSSIGRGVISNNHPIDYYHYDHQYDHDDNYGYYYPDSHYPTYTHHWSKYLRI